MSKILTIKQISTKLNVPTSVIEWSLSKVQDISKDDVFESKASGGKCLSFNGFLRLIASQPFQVSADGLIELCDMYSDQSSIDDILRENLDYKEQLDKAAAKNAKLSLKLNKIRDILGVEAEAESEDENKKEENGKKEDKRTKIPLKNPEWWDEMKPLVKIAANRTGMTFTSILRQAYRAMENAYGVDFEEAEAEFIKEYGKAPDSKLKLVDMSDERRKIFEREVRSLGD